MGPGKEYMIYVGEYNPEDDTVRTREEIEATPKTIEMGFDEFERISKIGWRGGGWGLSAAQKRNYNDF